MSTILATSGPRVNGEELRTKVQEIYTAVAQTPEGKFHFAMGRPLATRLGYSESELNGIPEAAVASFAGVGYHFGLAGPVAGERILDLGSGSGMDTFIAARYVAPTGAVIGVDMTDAQLRKSRELQHVSTMSGIEFVKAYIESLPFPDASFDLVISNGVINLSAEKERVFLEIARILKPGGRLALSDIVTEIPLKESITCDANLWAACIGGAAQQDAYRATIEAAGLSVETVLENVQYAFLSKSAIGASKEYGVKSISLLARKSSHILP